MVHRSSNDGSDYYCSNVQGLEYLHRSSLSPGPDQPLSYSMGLGAHARALSYTSL